MRKEIIFLIWILLISSCSVSRYSERENDIAGYRNAGILNNRTIIDRNLSGNSFFIQKAEIEVVEGKTIQHVQASVKFSLPDSFLISIRSNTGLEAARIFMTKDTLIVNDRINKILYYGSEEAFKKKYGFTNRMLGLLWGDLIVRTNNINSEIVCQDATGKVEDVIDGKRIVYNINCKSAKVEAIAITGYSEAQPINVYFEDFRNIGEKRVANTVSIKGYENYDIIKIKYSKIETDWSGGIKFVPGKNYEHVELK